MELIGEEATIVDCFTAVAGASWVPALEDEVRDKSVEDRVSVVAVEDELEEVTGGEGCLGGPELDVEVAVGGFEDYFGTFGGLVGFGRRGQGF